MSEFSPKTGFVLAAGKGTRLRPYTDTMPKPMVPIAGKSIIHRTLEKLEREGVSRVIVNLHHLAPVLEAHLMSIKKPQIILSHENDLLETGGGVKKALPDIGPDPFYLINGDALWDEAEHGSALSRLAAAWNDNTMDILLLLQPVGAMDLTDAVGDYDVAPDSRAIRNLQKNGRYMFAGVRIVHPRIFDGTQEGAFSFLSLMDRAQQKGRLYAIVHEGGWYHISTPEDLESVDAAFIKREVHD